MAKLRKKVAPSERAAVLAEYKFCCAACGASPMSDDELHHIDENPANNDRLNLLPLCPNCHTRLTKGPLPVGLIRILRVEKNPNILSLPFRRLYEHMAFLDDLEKWIPLDGEPMVYSTEISAMVGELLKFVRDIQAGGYYADKIELMLARVPTALSLIWFMDEDLALKQERRRGQSENDREYRERLEQARPVIHSLLVELLDYQPWRSPFTRSA